VVWLCISSCKRIHLLTRISIFVIFELMRKNLIVLFIAIAYSIVLCHSIIPHHHKDHHRHSHQHDHAQAHHHHDDGKAANNLNNLFDFFSHNAENYRVEKTNPVCTKLFVELSVILPDNYSVDQLPKPPLSNFCISDNPSFPGHCSFCYGLRAPPAI
jgi:hypothetical protein